MTIGNHNNELNARAHRNAVAENMTELRKVGAHMQHMLDMPSWSIDDEEFYDELLYKRDSLVERLKLAGMFL